MLEPEPKKFSGKNLAKCDGTWKGWRVSALYGPTPTVCTKGGSKPFTAVRCCEASVLSLLWEDKLPVHVDVEKVTGFIFTQVPPDKANRFFQDGNLFCPILDHELGKKKKMK